MKMEKVHEHSYMLSYTEKRNGEVVNYCYYCVASGCPNPFFHTSDAIREEDADKPIMGVMERRNQTATYNVINGKYYRRKS